MLKPFTFSFQWGKNMEIKSLKIHLKMPKAFKTCPSFYQLWLKWPLPSILTYFNPVLFWQQSPTPGWSDRITWWRLQQIKTTGPKTTGFFLPLTNKPSISGTPSFKACRLPTAVLKSHIVHNNVVNSCSRKGTYHWSVPSGSQEAVVWLCRSHTRCLKDLPLDEEKIWLM